MFPSILVPVALFFGLCVIVSTALSSSAMETIEKRISKK